MSSIQSHLEPLELRQDFAARDIYEFAIALKDFGIDFTRISKILRTKTPKQLEEFYKDNKHKFSFGHSVKIHEERKRVKLNQLTKVLLK